MKIKYMTLFLSLIILIGCNEISPAFNTYTQTKQVMSITQTHSFSTSTLTTTPTITQVFTLNPEQRNEKHSSLVDLLLSNGGCNLPCWWGISPGISTFEAFRQWANEKMLFPSHFSFHNNSPEDFDGYGIGESHFVENGGIIYSTASFFFTDGMLKNININGSYSSINLPDSLEFKEMWVNYLPENIIPKLGIPSRISIQLALSPGEGPIIGSTQSIFIFYDDRGILLNYQTEYSPGTEYLICPFINNGNLSPNINILLKSPGDTSSLESYAEYYFPELSFSIEETSGLTPRDFYSLFSLENNQTCFSTTPDSFPYP